MRIGRRFTVDDAGPYDSLVWGLPLVVVAPTTTALAQ